MRREIRIGLMLTAAACLVAVLVDWAVKELNTEATQAGIEAEQAGIEAEQAGVEAEQAGVEAEQAIVEAEQAIVEAEQEDTGRAEDATALAVGPLGDLRKIIGLCGKCLTSPGS